MHTPKAFEASFIFFPQPQLRGDPSHVGLAFENVWLTADDGVKIHAWFIHGDRADAGRVREPRMVMLLAHGNGGNISSRLDQYREFATRFPNVDVFALEYRGYGLSEGSPSEDGIALDALAARRWIDERIAADGSMQDARIVYFGRSLGGPVATRLAAAAPPDALILECPVSSIAALAKTVLPWRYLPIEKFIHNRFDTMSHISNVHCPLLLMHSEFDEIIPIDHGHMVFDASGSEKKRFYTIKGAPHNGADLYDPAGYYGAMGQFLDEMV